MVNKLLHFEPAGELAIPNYTRPPTIAAVSCTPLVAASEPMPTLSMLETITASNGILSTVTAVAHKVLGEMPQTKQLSCA